MNKIQTEAIILRVLNYKESDKLVTFYSRDHGKLTGIAKSARKSKKRFGTILEIFNILSIVFAKRRSANLVLIEEAQVVRPLLNITKDLRKISAASYFIELVSELSREGEPNRGEYEFLRDSLIDLDGKVFDEGMIRRFEYSILFYAGLNPEVTTCIRCRKPFTGDKKACFVFQEGGCFCAGCLPPHQPFETLSPETLGFLAGNNPGYSSVVRKELRETLPRYLTHCLGKELQTRRFMSKVFA